MDAKSKGVFPVDLVSGDTETGADLRELFRLFPGEFSGFEGDVHLQLRLLDVKIDERQVMLLQEFKERYRI